MSQVPREYETHYCANDQSNQQGNSFMSVFPIVAYRLISIHRKEIPLFVIFGSGISSFNKM